MYYWVSSEQPVIFCTKTIHETVTKKLYTTSLLSYVIIIYLIKYIIQSRIQTDCYRFNFFPALLLEF